MSSNLRRHPRALPWLAVALAVMAPAGATAQSQEPLWDQLQRQIKSQPISFGALFQFVGDVQADRSFPGENGFSVANFRFSVGGRLDDGFDYFLQSNFGELLDARIGITFSDEFGIDAGRFKVPFSREFLENAGSIDFVNRSQSVTALAQNRALGVQARGALTDELSYAAGVFNGGGGVGGNARGEMLGAARLSWQRDGVEVAVNAIRQGDRRVLGPTADPSVSTIQTLFGADTRITRDEWLFAAELDIGEGQIGSPDDPWGGFVTVGYHVEENSQLLVRLDHFDTGEFGDERTLLIPGWNLWPTSATELQVNAVLPLEGFNEDPQLLVNLQVQF